MIEQINIIDFFSKIQLHFKEDILSKAKLVFSLDTVIENEDFDSNTIEGITSIIACILNTLRKTRPKDKIVIDLAISLLNEPIMLNYFSKQLGYNVEAMNINANITVDEKEILRKFIKSNNNSDNINHIIASTYLEKNKDKLKDKTLVNKCKAINLLPIEIHKEIKMNLHMMLIRIAMDVEDAKPTHLAKIFHKALINEAIKHKPLI